MAGFDELIERLLYDVALSGSQGFDAKRLESAVRAYYDEKNEHTEGGDVELQQNPLFADAPPIQQTAVDETLLVSVLGWLCRHPEVELRRVQPDEDLSKTTENDTAASSVALKLEGKRIFTTEDRMWHAIAGHGPDLRRIPQLEFDILSLVAAYGSTGVLQPFVVRTTGQDKRSVPKRTDKLQEKGYITKETVIGGTGKTSLLKLKRFFKTQSLEKSPEETEINNQKPIIHYDRMYNTMMRMLQENDGTVTTADLRIGLGIAPFPAGTWEARILARCIRRLEEGGCIRRVTAKMVDAEGNVMDTIGHQNWRRAKAVQLMRPPTQYDRLLWEQSDPQIKHTASDDEEEQEDVAAAMDVDGEDDDDLVELGAVEEVAPAVEQLKALGQKTTKADAVEEDDDELDDLDRLMDRIPPQWTPHGPLVNLLFNKIDEAGEAGISSNQLQAAIVGPLWKRPMDELLSHLTDIWQHSQPPHLRHLTVVRDTAVFGRSAQFKYRTLPNFEKAVAAGKADWGAVLDNTSSKAKKKPLQVQPDPDSWGFPKIPSKLLAGRDGRATLADGRKGCQVEPMNELDLGQNAIVADDGDESPAVVPAPKSKKAAQRKRKSSALYESTAAAPQQIRAPVVTNVNGFTVNGKRMGRPRRQRSEATEQARLSVPATPAVTAPTEGQESLRARPRRSSAARGRSIQDASASAERTMSESTEMSKRKYTHTLEFIQKHPELEWVHLGGGRYSLAKPRDITEEEVMEFEKFATKTAENRVRLELTATRKRSADQAGLSDNDTNAKKIRAETGEAVSTTILEGHASDAAQPVPIDQLSSARIEVLKKEIMERQKPGLYINPPGAKEMKAKSFPARGRPRKAKIAVFKSERLRDFEWYKSESGPRFAEPKPLGRKSISMTGRSLQISDERVDYSGSDFEEARHASKQHNTSAAVVEDSDSDREAAGPTRKLSATIIVDSDSESERPVRKRQRTVQTPAQELSGISGTQVLHDELTGLPSNTAVPGQKIGAQLPASASAPSAPTNPHSFQAMSNTQFSTLDSSAKNMAADSSVYHYLARYKTEDRDTPQKQYQRLFAKPGRKSKRDMELLAELERLYGPQPRAPVNEHKLKPTEIPDENSIAEAKQQLRRSFEQGRNLGSVAAISASAGGFTPVNTAQSARAASDPTPSTMTQSAPAVAEDSSDDSGTDNEDWATPQLVAAAAGRTATANTASSSQSLSLQQAMDQAVTAQPAQATPPAVSKPATSNEYFATSYVDTHPDEIFYHAGGGRWRRGKPPAGHSTQAWRGPGAPGRLAPLSQHTSIGSSQPTTPGQTSSRVVPRAQAAQMLIGSSSRSQPSALNIARPYMTTPATKASTPAPKATLAPKATPLMIVRPYETPNANSQERSQKQVESTAVPEVHGNDDADETLVDQDIALDLQEHDDLEDGTYGGEDEMEIDTTEQTATPMTELTVSGALKPKSTQKKTGGVKRGASTESKRRDVILSALQQCGGVFPGNQEMWYVLSTTWKKLYGTLPDRHTVERTVEQLMVEKKLRRFQFKFKSKRSNIITKNILAEPSISPDDEAVTQLKKHMMKTYPASYLPPGVDIDEEYRESASNKRRRKTKNGDVSEPRPEDYPEDPALIVKQTAMAAARADEDAQKKGFANAQALREHMQEMNKEMKERSWQKRTEMQRKERMAIAREEELIAADLEVEEAEVLDDADSEFDVQPQLQMDDADSEFDEQPQKRRRRTRDRETGELPGAGPLRDRSHKASEVVPEGVEYLNAYGKPRRRQRDPETGELLPLAPLANYQPQKKQESQARQSAGPTSVDVEMASEIVREGVILNENGKPRRRKRDPETGELLPLVPLLGGTQLSTPNDHDGIAIAPREPESATPVMNGTHFEHYVPPAQPPRPARKPLGSTRGPAIVREKPFKCPDCDRWFSRSDNLNQHRRTHDPKNVVTKRWYDHEKRLHAATLAHLFSPAQTFLPTNGTFGTSGTGVTQQVMYMRGDIGPMSVEEYQAADARKAARDAARIKRYGKSAAADEAKEDEEAAGAQKGSSWAIEEDVTMIRLKEIDGLSWKEIVAQLPGRTENSCRFRYSAMVKNRGYTAPPTRILKFNIPKEKLKAIVSVPPNPATAKKAKEDATLKALAMEAADTPDSDAMSDFDMPPPKKRRKYTSRKTNQAVDDEAMDESDDDFVPRAAQEFEDDRASGRLPKLKGPGARGIKKAFTTRNRNALSGFKDADRLVVAIALISAIAGGLSQDKMNWSLIAHALSYLYEGDFLRRRWEHFKRSRRGDVERIRDAIRQPFLEAYEKDELPVVNLQESHKTDWPALFDWVNANIPETKKMSETVDEQPDIPDLPASKELLQAKFRVHTREPVWELNKDDFLTTITDQSRRTIAQRVTLGDVFPDETKPSESMNNELLLAKSWIRAVAMTKQNKYIPELAAKKISVLGNKVLKKVATDMVEAKMFIQDKRGRQLPGRNFQIHHEVLVQFRRWPATREIDEHRYLCALAQSWTKINEYFKQADELLLTPVTSDQDYTVLTNLVANSMLKIKPVFPETKWEFDAPLPRLSPWGYSGNSYQTKKADPSQLKYDLMYIKTENYKIKHELNTSVPVPTVPATIEGEPGPRIPFWVDIHGNLIDDIWDMSLRSILHLLVFRTGIRALTMQLAHNHKLWQWEIEMILSWMEKVGLAVRCGEGEEIDGRWNGGWNASQWWFCAFLPEMIRWEPPLMGGFVEVG